MLSLNSTGQQTGNTGRVLYFSLEKSFSDDLSLRLKTSMDQLRSTQVMEGDLSFTQSLLI